MQDEGNIPFRNLKGQNLPVTLHPDPLLAAERLSVSIVERFLCKVKHCGDCMIWDGAVGGAKGYPTGTLLRGRRKGGNIYATRVSWLIYNGEIPICKSIMQDCPFGNTLCVHPNHLRIASPAPVRKVQRVTGHRPLTAEQEARCAMLCAQAGTTKEAILQSLIPTHVTPKWLIDLGYSETFAERFWSKIKRVGECLIWQGALDSSGYGSIGKSGTGHIGAHVAAMMLHTGKPIPEGMQVLHNCPGGDKPACCNWEHLWLGTVAQNNYDARQKHQARSKNNRHWNSTFSDEALADMQAMLSAGESKVAIATKHNTSAAHVRQLLRGRKWNHKYFKVTFPGTLPHGTRTGNTMSGSSVMYWPPISQPTTLRTG